MIMNISSITIVKQNVNTPILNEVNLNNFIVPTQIHIVIKSDKIQFLSVNHQPQHIPIPTPKPIPSITLIL